MKSNDAVVFQLTANNMGIDIEDIWVFFFSEKSKFISSSGHHW